MGGGGRLPGGGGKKVMEGQGDEPSGSEKGEAEWGRGRGRGAKASPRI